METLRALERAARRLADLDDKRAALAAERDQLVKQAVREGESLRVVADAAGLSHGAIALIRDARPNSRSGRAPRN